MADQQRLVTGRHKLAADLCAALGLNPRLTQRIELEVDIHQPIRLRTAGFVTEDRLAQVVRTFELFEGASWQEVPPE